MVEEGNMNLEELLETYGDQLYRIGLLLLKNREDTEDAVQETLYKYMRKHPEFNDSEHAGRWLMKVMINECRNIQRFRFRYVPLLIEDIPSLDDNDREVLRTIETLPYKDREVLLKIMKHAEHAIDYSSKYDDIYVLNQTL